MLVTLGLLFQAGILSAQVSPFFPSATGFLWSYATGVLDTLQRPVESLQGTRWDLYTGNGTVEGRAAVLLMEQLGGPPVIGVSDSVWWSVTPSEGSCLFPGLPALPSVSRLDAIGLNGLRDRFPGWYSVYHFAASEGFSYDIFRYDSTVVLDSLGAFPLRILVTGERLADRTVTVPHGTFPSCKTFLITSAIGTVVSVPIIGDLFFPIVQVRDSVWIANGTWVVKTFRPATRVDLSAVGGPTDYVPGSFALLQSSSVLAVADERLPASGDGSLLMEAYPDPFNPSTEIRLHLPSADRVRLEVFDVAGRAVKMLFEGDLAAGVHAFEWDARGLSSGTYITRAVGSHSVTSRMIRLIR
jgi:hypothetical protein